MPHTTHSTLFYAALAGLYFSSHITAHMDMVYPVPIRSKYSSMASIQSYSSFIDYSMTSPLLADGSDYPCKGYQTAPSTQYQVTSFTAGSSYNVTISGTDYPGTPQNVEGTALAQHSGGSCQISLSYDNGATFTVIQSILGGCPIVPTGQQSISLHFTIPSDAPSASSASPALLAWSWFNKIGNREMYMNCARVEISTPSAKRSVEDPYHGHHLDFRPHHRKSARPNQARALSNTGVIDQRSASIPFVQLPAIFTANIGTKSPCTTVEGCDYVFPDPGPNVSYGNGTTPASCAGGGGNWNGFLVTPDCAASNLKANNVNAVSSSVTATTFATSTLTGGASSNTATSSAGIVMNTSSSMVPSATYRITDTTTLAAPTVTKTVPTITETQILPTGTATYTQSLQPSSTSTPTLNDSCTNADDGKMECFPAEGGKQIRECVFGAWVYSNVASGTVCRYSGYNTGVYMGWPKRAMGKR